MMQHQHFKLHHALTTFLLAVTVFGTAQSSQAATVHAKDYGYNAQDATAALQAAINSGAEKVIVSNMGTPWIVRPIFLTSNQELVFEPGVVISAKRGEFHGTNDSLFTGNHQRNITINAYGAVFKMHREDYTGGGYSYSQWRHVFYMLSCDRVTFLGGTYRDSGGDGIFIGSFENQPACTNFHVKDVLCDNNYRQGISVTSAENCLIEDSQMNNTWGQEPQAGIDFEPDGPSHRLVNCVVRNCKFINNNKPGILVYPQMLSASSPPLSITFERCYVSSANGWGIQISPLYGGGVMGFIDFKDCVIEDTLGPALFMQGKAAYRAQVRFTRTTWRRTAKASVNGFPANPFVLTGEFPHLTPEFGGIQFTDCLVEDSGNRPWLQALVPPGSRGLANIKGNVTVLNPFGSRIDWGAGSHDNNLAVSTSQPTPFPTPSQGTPHATPTPGPARTVYAKDYGFHETDATDALQNAINSGADRVVVSNMGKDWVVRPIVLAARQELVFEPGVVVSAKSGEFRGVNDSLFSAEHKSGIKVRGAENVVLRMRKEDYRAAGYEPSPWRHGFYLLSCRDVEISDLTVRDTGGDGIFVGSFVGQPPCRDVRVRNVVSDNNTRQGMSVTNARDVLIEKSVFKNTSGQAPESGLHFESDGESQELVNCVVRDCRFENNAQGSIVVNGQHLTSRSADLGLVFESCTMTSAKGWGIQLNPIMQDGPRGAIEFRKCVIEDVRGPGLYVNSKHAYRAAAVFTECTWKNVAQESVNGLPANPIILKDSSVERGGVYGGLQFKGCILEDRQDRAFMVAQEPAGSSGVANVKGDIVVLNPNGVRMELGAKAHDVALNVKTKRDVDLVATATAVPNAQGVEKVLVYPNPARDRLSIKLEVREPQRVLISLFNTAGEKVREISEYMDPSFPVITCEVKNLATGVYCYLVKQKGKTKKGRFAIIR